MKYNKEKVRQCAIWVEKHGLDQHGGATINSFCKAQDITFETYSKWMQKNEFSESIKAAREVFRATLANELYQSLKARATGYDTTKTRTEYVEDKNGNVRIKKRTTEEMHVNGDTQAAIFLLTNVAPETWSNVQKTEMAGGIDITKKEATPSIDELNAEIARLQKADE